MASPRAVLIGLVVLATAGTVHGASSLAEPLTTCTTISQPFGGEEATCQGYGLPDIMASISDISTWLSIYQQCMPIINKTTTDYPNGAVPTYFTIFAPNNTAFEKSNFTNALAKDNLTLADLQDSGAICSIFAFHLLPVAESTAQLNETALPPGTGFPFADTTTSATPTVLTGHNITIQPKKKLALWGDLSVKWNNATTQQADAFCVCGYCGSIINNVLLPNSPNKIAPWGQPTPVGTGPGDNGAAALFSSTGMTLLSTVAAAAMLLLSL